MNFGENSPEKVGKSFTIYEDSPRFNKLAINRMVPVIDVKICQIHVKMELMLTIINVKK